MIHVFNKQTGEYIGWREQSTDLIDETTVAPPAPTETHCGYWTGTEWELRKRSIDVATLVAEAWSAADAHLTDQFDAYSQISASAKMVDPTCPDWRKLRILDVMAWITSVWTHYATVKMTIQSGTACHYDRTIPGDCPWSIWQITSSTP